ncbi:hypothetical protein Leryth_017616 [Lithospermum erythrorhizon]|nr:hypothetical protein Leryth_017616 [Lithospermum erythrorhizon]
MGTKKSLVSRREGAEYDEEEVSHVPLKAILLADSFASNFRPITLERPKVLLPLVNVPMIDYTLAWLQSEDVEQVFVFCCAHSDQLISYLETSKWFTQPNFLVKIIKSTTALTVGDALRTINYENVIHEDFVLVSGDTVSNMPLSNVIKEHKDRRKKDSNVLMTMVIKQSKPSPVTHQSRFGTDELLMAIDPCTRQLFYYQENTTHSEEFISPDKAFLTDNHSMCVNNDKQVCYIDICSEEVLRLFDDNFDYQHLRPDFVRDLVKGSLLDDIMSYKIFTYEIPSSYAAIDNFRSYDTISKDIIQRWTYPYVPDVQFHRNSATKHERCGIYRASDIDQSRSAEVGPFTVIGNGTKIGNTSKISNSVVGESCTIGSNVSIDGCYIWNNVTIEDGCQLKHAIVCDGVVLKSGSVLEPGVVLSIKVIIGRNVLVPAYSKVSLLQQPTKVDSDEELEYADSSSSITYNPSSSEKLDMVSKDLKTEMMESQLCTASEVGSDGAGFIWSIPEGSLEGEWRHSVAPIPPEKLSEITQRINAELYINQDRSIVPASGELEPDSISDVSDDTDSDKDMNAFFEKEVDLTFRRAVHENTDDDTVIFLLNQIRMPLLLHAEDCASALFYSMMKFALDTPHSSHNELLRNVSNVIKKWKNVLKTFMKTIDQQFEVILKFEEICSESMKEYSRIFVEILHLLYEKDLILEDAVIRWAIEKEGADESDKVFVKKAEVFIQWLKEASEADDDEDDDD